MSLVLKAIADARDLLLEERGKIDEAVGSLNGMLERMGNPAATTTEAVQTFHVNVVTPIPAAVAEMKEFGEAAKSKPRGPKPKSARPEKPIPTPERPPMPGMRLRARPTRKPRLRGWQRSRIRR